MEHLQRMREKAQQKRAEKLNQKMPIQEKPQAPEPQHTPVQTPQPPPPPKTPTYTQPQQNIQQPLIIQQHPDFSNFIKRSEVDSIVKNALNPQHQVMLQKAKQIKEEQRIKKEQDDKEKKQKDTVHNLMYPKHRRNKWY